ncbi:MAG: STAS domain-containing protein [Spirochaetes bacterium]|nr:STAS domain-containing protein [Spirochaetota bacterium]
MRITWEMRGGCAVYHIEASVELFSADGIMKDLLESIQVEGFTKVVLDFGGVDYIDSSGLAALLHMRKLCNDSVKIRIAAPQMGISRLFEMTNLSGYLPVDQTVEESLEMIKE